ncbi:MAG: hypothetical protein M3N97_07670 [Pseudomonadota bacterium]|nr:hypothetical protein [Pseudomonadota bacterium]
MWKAGIAAIVLICVAEVTARLSGITDFAVYAVDSDMGYIVKPSQSGTFLHKNSWAFNSKSMPTTEEWNPNLRPNVLLIGNSILMGGNPYDQKDKVAPLVMRDTANKYSIWPVAIGGWSTVNEVAYLRRNPDVVKAADFFVWEYMSGGLSSLSEWRGDYVFPSMHPLSSSLYALRRYVAPHFLKINTNELPPVGTLGDSNLAGFDAAIAQLSSHSRSPVAGVIFLYPTRAELLSSQKSVEWLPERAILTDMFKKYRVVVIDVAKQREWNASLYRDGVHPTIAGNEVLAKMLASAIEANFVPDPPIVPDPRSIRDQ